MSNLSKSNQIKSVMRWLSKDALPSYIKSFHKINLWHRDLEGGNLALAITNASFDEAEDIEVMIRTNKKLIRVFDMNCKETVIPSSGTDGPYQKFIIPYVDAWQIRLVMCE